MSLVSVTLLRTDTCREYKLTLPGVSLHFCFYLKDPQCVCVCVCVCIDKVPEDGTLESGLCK